MIWQEWIFAIGSWLFVLALIPLIRSSSKPPRWSTCGLAGGILWLFAIAFGTMGLYLSAGGTGMTAMAWTIIFFQRGKV